MTGWERLGKADQLSALSPPGGQGSCPACDQSSRPGFRSVDVDPGARTRSAYRASGSIDGIWTARTVAVLDKTRNSQTVLTLDKVKYNLPMRDVDFTRENLSK